MPMPSIPNTATNYPNQPTFNTYKNTKNKLQAKVKFAIYLFILLTDGLSFITKVSYLLSVIHDLLGGLVGDNANTNANAPANADVHTMQMPMVPMPAPVRMPMQMPMPMPSANAHAHAHALANAIPFLSKQPCKTNQPTSSPNQYSNLASKPSSLQCILHKY